MKIIIISTISQHKELYDLEFIRPIVDIVNECDVDVAVIDLEDVNGEIGADKYILTGTSYQDNDFLEHKEKVKFLLDGKKPLLGICAGAELLLPEDVELEEVQEIGPRVVEELNEDELLAGLDGKECYFLHQKGIRAIPFDNNELLGLLATQKGIAAFRYKDKPIWGLQFHPEVDHKEIIKRFIQK